MKRLITGIGVCAIAAALFATQVFAAAGTNGNTNSNDGGKLNSQQQSGNSNNFVIVKDGKVNGLSVEAYIAAELAKGKALSDVVSKLLTAGLNPVAAAVGAAKAAPTEAGNVSAQIAKANPALAPRIAAAVVKVVVDANPDMVSEVMGKTADAVRDKNPEMVDDIKTAVINEVKINHPELVAALQAQRLDRPYVAYGSDFFTKEAASPAI